MKPEMMGPTTGPLWHVQERSAMPLDDGQGRWEGKRAHRKGPAVYMPMGAPTSFGLKTSATVPPATERKADPAAPPRKRPMSRHTMLLENATMKLNATNSAHPTKYTGERPYLCGIHEGERESGGAARVSARDAPFGERADEQREQAHAEDKERQAECRNLLADVEVVLDARVGEGDHRRAAPVCGRSSVVHMSAQSISGQGKSAALRIRRGNLGATALHDAAAQRARRAERRERNARHAERAGRDDDDDEPALPLWSIERAVHGGNGSTRCRREERRRRRRGNSRQGVVRACQPHDGHSVLYCDAVLVPLRLPCLLPSVRRLARIVRLVRRIAAASLLGIVQGRARLTLTTSYGRILGLLACLRRV